MIRPLRRDRGFALLIVLWSLVLITLVLTQVTAAGRSEADLAGNLRRAASLRAQTDGVVHLAIFHLLDPAAPWAADGADHIVALAGATATVRIIDEAGKINPNLATPGILAGLLRAVGQGADDADRIADAIVQWRYPSATAAGVGEDAQRYRAAGRDYAPPHASFQSVAEIGLVLGMTPELLAQLAPHLTLQTDNDTDARVADPVVRRALALAGIAAQTGPVPPPRVITITAAATAGDARFGRRAVVSLNGDRAGRLFRIVEWGSYAP